MRVRLRFALRNLAARPEVRRTRGAAARVAGRGGRRSPPWDSSRAASGAPSSSRRARCWRPTCASSPHGRSTQPTIARPNARGLARRATPLHAERRVPRRGIVAGRIARGRARVIRCAAELKIADGRSGRAPIVAIPGPGEAWADSRLLARLDAPRRRCASTWVRTTVVVTRVLDYRPDQGSGFADLSATLLINLADVPVDRADPAGQPRESRRPVRRRPAGRGGFRDWLRRTSSRASGCESVADASPQIRGPPQIAPAGSCRSRAW